MRYSEMSSRIAGTSGSEEDVVFQAWEFRRWCFLSRLDGYLVCDIYIGGIGSRSWGHLVN